MNSEIRTKLNLEDILRWWLITLQPGIGELYFSRNMDAFFSVIRCYGLERLPQYAQTLWEFPLLGITHCDISFCYNQKIMDGNRFVNPEGKRIEPLLRHLISLCPYLDIWTNVKVPRTKDQLKIPSVFLNVTNNMPVIMERTWARGAEPTQWKKLQDIWSNLVPGWEMHYIGLMPGRINNPLRLIFKRRGNSGQTESASLDEVRELLANVGFRYLEMDTKVKLKQLEQLGFKEWEISFDLYPDNSFGELLEVEISMVEDGVNPVQLATSAKLQNLQINLQRWGLADERIEYLQNLIGCKDLQFYDEAISAFVYTFLSHIKLRWNGITPLPAKAYLTHNYELMFQN